MCDTRTCAAVAHVHIDDPLKFTYLFKIHSCCLSKTVSTVCVSPTLLDKAHIF